MKITTLVENNSISRLFENEHGLALYIEYGNHKILFDTGFSGVFIDNAEKLNIDIEEINLVVISHGHYDHIGGLLDFFALNNIARVYAHKKVFDFNYYSKRGGEKKYIGPPVELKEYKDRFIFLNENISIGNLHFITGLKKQKTMPKANTILYKVENNKLYKDDFDHEIIFVIETSEGLVVFCGCAHNGILNTLDAVREEFKTKKIHSVIGGFHLLDKNERTEIETVDELSEIGRNLKELNIAGKFYTGHCTGKDSYSALKGILKNKLHSFSTGKIIYLFSILPVIFCQILAEYYW